MKRKLRGIRRSAIQLDFNLYRVPVPIKEQPDMALSVIDLWPEDVEPTIVFVHGYAGCAETWEHQINYFSRDFRVVVPDLRGHGQSDAPDTDYTMDELVEDLDTITEKLHLPEKFILVGHSFGGSICVEYATKYPERLEKLVLIATAGEYPLPWTAKVMYRIPAALYSALWDLRPRWNADVHVMKRMLGNNMHKWNGWHLLRELKTPTLLITGEFDTYFPREVYDEVIRTVPGAEVVSVGSAKHKVQLERHEAVNRAIDRFIRNQRRSWRGPSARADLIERRPWLLNYSYNTPYTIPLPRQSLHHFLEGAALWVPRRTALIFYGTHLTYQQLNAQVNQFAHALCRMGVQPGDRVMVMLPNVPPLIIAYYAILKIGGVVVLPNPDADSDTIVKDIQQTGAKIFITLTAFDTLAQTVKETLPTMNLILADLRHIVTPSIYRQLSEHWGSPTFDEDPDVENIQQGQIMADLMADEPEHDPNIDVASSSQAVIVYTSGTTDEPRAVALTHSNLVANALQTRHWISDLEYGREVFLSVLPIMHCYGMTTAMNLPVALGAAMVLLPMFDLNEVFNHIKLYRPTVFPGVPSMYTAINHAPHVRSYGLASIKACISGAAPLPVEVQEEFEKVTRGRLIEGYGLTEASPITHANPMHGVRKVGTIGIPLPNTDAKIVDLATGEDLLPGEIGELVVRGPQVMHDGWLYTGDVAVSDTDGFFQILGRKQDTITIGTHKVYPRDIEEVLYENSKVREVAVVGIEHHIKAFVVPRPGTTLTVDELLDLCHRRLEDYAVPSEIEFREELPKSFVGKVVRRLLVGEQE